MNKHEQGVAITHAIGELKKFYNEVGELENLIQSKIQSELKNQLKQGGEFKIDLPNTEIKIINKRGGNAGTWEWRSLSIPVYKHGAKKDKLENLYFYLNIQLSFAGSAVANIQPAKPQIHIGIDGVPIGEDEYFYAYPISKSDEGYVDANSIFIEQNSLLKYVYDVRDYWQYSIELLSVNASNLEELIIQPVVQLLNENKWEVVKNSALDKALIRYENEDLVFTD